MELFTLAIGLCLPWLLGVVWLRAPWLKASNIKWPTLLGYGYLGGILLTTLVMRLLDTLGIHLSFFSIGLALVLLIAAGTWFGRGEPWRIRWPGIDLHSLSGWRKIVYAIVLAAIVIRLVGLGLEIVWRPLFPWDAWSQWATKARVWYELGHLAAFVPADVWLGGELAGAYTDTAPHYPPAIPLIQVWMCYSLGRWDDTLMNLPWLLCAVALGLAFYGQARQWQVPPLFALMFTYFLLSLPFVNVHVALAGYTDLFMAAFYGLAAMAFFHWARKRDFWQGAVALLFALGCILIKQPGIAWALTFLPAILVVFMPRAGLMLISAMAIAGVATLFVLGETDFKLFGYHVYLRFSADWQPFLQNMLVMENWHLFWYLVVAALALSFPRLLIPSLRSMTVLLVTAISFLAVVFFFTHAQAWAEDYTTINRALLHIVPMLLFYVMVLFREAAVSLPTFMTTRQKLT